MRIPLTVYGLPEVVILPAVIFLIMIVFLAGGLFFLPGLVIFLSELILAAILLWVLSFFRDPYRLCPRDSGLFLSPADGRVTDIETVAQDDFLGSSATRIGIFLSIFDVHINRAPCNVRVEKVTSRRGAHRDARSPCAGRLNAFSELSLVRIDYPQDRVLVRQVSGAIAQDCLLRRAGAGSFCRREVRYDKVRLEDGAVAAAAGRYKMFSEDGRQGKGRPDGSCPLRAAEVRFVANMPRFRSESARDRILRRVRRQRLKYITVLPSLITILNGVCGFAAIVFAARAEGLSSFSYHRLVVPYFAVSGYMILFAMVADMLDGRLARMNKSTSSFGGQLDSLCDMISFGVAPAFLMLRLLDYQLSLAEDISPLLVSFLYRFVWLVAAGYISCAAIRLARFNVENEQDESAHMSFVGLPSPAAAGCLVSLIIFQQESLPDISVRSPAAFVFFEDAIMYLLPAVAIVSAILMVSRIRYPHVLNQYIRGRKPFAHLIRVLLFMALVIWSRQAAMVLIFCGFAASGVVKWFYYRVIRKGTGLGQPAVSQADTGGVSQIGGGV